MFDTSLKRKWDNKAVLDYAVSEAVKEAAYNTAVDIARDLKRGGFSVEQIAKYTKLSIKEIEKF
ncbi:hypothetical protein GCM10011386_44060 [Parapedobacter defluvii]|uniref:Uncharacterized protein n=1 Tax=Parapedobacter defluvii TaxID=2045106 RepID=A0ABQ1MU56_9SPHI|nr:hypothetical protein [Parapedobacter defluvii]GGC47095.1 hypothetical protein GCM10011386_44060 [Parapedobacter defluvii]